MRDVPGVLFKSVPESNYLRIRSIADNIKNKCPKGTIGLYKIAMKSGSDNARDAAILKVMAHLSDKDHRILIYDPDVRRESVDIDPSLFVETEERP